MKLHICKYCHKQFESGCLLGNHISKQCIENPNRGKQKNSKIWKCTICNKEFESRRVLQKHRKEEHGNLSEFAYGIRPVINKPCRYCGKICSRANDLTRHEKYCKENPNKEVWKSHKITDEVKKKLSDAAIKNLQGSHCNWLNKPKSYAEEYFDKIFVNAEKQLRIGRYVLDYAWPENKEYIEVDGEQHYTEDGMKHDEERTKVLSDLGWKCILRIRWSEYQKLSFENKQKFLKENHLID